MFRNVLKFILIITLIFCLVFSSKEVAAFQFEKSPNNPLPIIYIDDYVNQQQANIFYDNNIYKGIIAIHRPPEMYHSLGYFESVDGIDWVMKKEILSTGSDLSNPSILKTQTGYILFVTSYDNNTVYRIYSSICDFSFNCSDNFSPVIIPDTNNNSEKNGVFAGHPFQQDNRTYLFFGAWGNDGFKIKLAYTEDLISWQRCSNTYLYGGDGPFPYKENNDLYLFFHQSDNSGIKLAKTSLPLNCDSVFIDQGYMLVKDNPYDQKHLIFPSILNENGDLKLYYSGLGDDSQWRLNLACTGQACLLSTPTPTPVPKKTPVIIIPGFMASWNKEAILHNQTVDYFEWKLQNFVKEYDGLINSLKNTGYQQNINLFLFPYDWRQSIEKTTDDLNNYLQEKLWDNNPNQKINIVGHSLGGLIGRIFAQKNKDKINQFISVGSPHQGVVQAYKPLESGEIDRENTFLWLAEKIILTLNKSTLENDRVTIINKFPVAKDLFPTFNFLKDFQGNEIPFENLTIKNNLLSLYNQSFYNIFPIFTAIYGEKDNNTLAGYVVEPQNIVDKLLGNYSDGKPTESYFDLGDYTILSKSASQDTDSEKYYFDHGEIISKKDAIKKILSLLNINFSDDQIAEGHVTKISPSLIFLIKSPATMTVEFENNIHTEDEGIIFIPNAKSGSYNLKVQGTDQGKYEVVVGQISENNDIWESIDGEIAQSPASSQVDDYNILYNNQTAFSIFPTPTITPILIPTMEQIPTETPVPTSTPTAISKPTLVPTSIPISTNSLFNNQSIQSSDNEVPISKESASSVLGISSNEKELIVPTIKITREKERENEIKKSSIWNFIFLPTFSIILGGIAWLFKKKLFKK